MGSTTDPGGEGHPSSGASGLGALRRFGLVLATWSLIGLAQPGALRPDGFGHLAFFAIGPWVWAARRPGRRAFLSEWAAHSIGLAGVFAWMLAFLPAILLPMSVVPALLPAASGVALRRAGPWPLALLAPAAWTAAEVARWVIPVPFSFGWFRLGTLMHDTEWLVGSAAWFGTWGLTWALAALGGWAADRVDGLLRDEGAPAPRPGATTLSWLTGLGPLAGLAALDAAAAPPAMRDGPDVLVVQPGIEQEIKAAGLDPFRDMYGPQVTRTLRALYETRPPGAVGDAAQPDLVLWGETFLPGKFASPEVVAAFEAGARPAPWARPLESARELRGGDLYARGLAGVLFGDHAFRRDFGHLWPQTFGAPDGPEFSDRVLRSERLLPPGTSFLSGVEAWTAQDGMLRSVNGVVLWDAEGRPGPVAPKVHVVPGGESAEPLRGIPFVLGAIQRVAKNVPDFVGAEKPTVLTLRTRDGDAFRFAVTVCYDNAFDDVYAGPVRDEPVDFYVVASNEAWYGASPEMDHMLAFSRVHAASVQRAIVRATNSGISCVVGPDGKVARLLEEEGRRKMVSGALRATVPVPDAGRGAAGATFFARTQPLQPWAFGGAGLMFLVAALVAGRRRGVVAAG